MKPSLIVHGGAWDIPDEAVDACKAGCERALAAGLSILNQGGSALDAVQAAVMVLEDDPVFDAGFGSHLTLDGHVECDAIKGALLTASASQNVWSATCEMSTIIPSRFISRIKSRPCAVSPFHCAAEQHESA